MKTMICLILDRSGSMGGRETDVINGVNSFLIEQQKLPDPACIAFVRFDSEATERFRQMSDLGKCAPLTRDDYLPRGGTPLLDAVGKTVMELEEDWKRERPERAIVVIVTDGQENASHEYTKEKVRALIKARQDSGLWSFIYLGANVDSFAEAGSLGILRGNTANYTSTTQGTENLYSTLSASVHQMRFSGATVAHNLGGDIGEDPQANKATPSVPARPPVAPAPAAAAVETTWVPPVSGHTATAASIAPGAWTPPV